MDYQKLSNLRIGDTIYFLEGYPNEYRIQAKNDQYIIATVKAEKGVNYTIIDMEKGMCGPHDRTFQLYDFKTKAGVDELLSDLTQKKYGIQLSQRHSGPVGFLLNLPKTLSQVS